MIYVLLGFLVLILVLLLSRWIAAADPAAMIKTVRWALIVGVVLALGAIAWIGRYQLAAFVLPFLIPAFIRWRLGSAPPGGSGGSQPRQRSGAMTREEAYAILGLQPGADAEAIRAAHRRLMSQLHPDKGGSDYLAAQINRARDVLLGQ